MKLIKEIKLNPNYQEKDLLNAICKKTKLISKDIMSYEIITLGIDARKKPNVKIVLNIAINVKKEKVYLLKNFEDIIPDHQGISYNKKSSKKQPVIVGFGPSGMFCALALALAGYNPIVLERGKCVQERQNDVSEFWTKGNLNENSNVQYGEGGAGTFSDGKLNTTLNNKYCKKVINEFILNGAPKEIFYKNKAHIGTDNLKQIVVNIRNKIIKNGGKVLFSAKFINFETKNGQICSVSYLDLNSNKIFNIETDNLILATGHSAIDVFELLKKQNVKLRKKPFAMGVRIEMPQSLVNLAQYGQESNYLPPADFKLVEHLENHRSVFSFCMCPGGEVVASSSEKGSIVTNGMSNFKRDGKYANSALLVNVTPEDFEGEDVLSGLYFQRKYEKLAYNMTKGYSAPAMTVGDFLNQKNNFDKELFCTYKPKITFCDINQCLPDFVAESIKQALPLLNNKLKGITNPTNILIAPETRSSCPVQFERDQDYSCTFKGLRAIGEGAGFAGGIISSAVDGLKCAENIINN